MRQIRKYQKDKGRILNSNKLLYHSIPIGCILALLLLGSICINPLGLSFGDDSNEVYAEEGISELADTGISLTISGNLNETINADTKNVAYRAHTVKATASSIDSYSLSISYTDGSTSLRNSDANVSIGDVASSGVSGNSMQANTWGWGWSDSASTNNSDITYRPISTSQSIIKSDNSPVNNTANIEGKLAFAAKFPEGSAAGHYTANVLVSFAIEPKAITVIPFGGMTTMQEINSLYCSGISEGVEGRLEDTRDGKLYWVAKLKDGNCWMTQNLDYDGGGTKVTDLSATGLPTSAGYYDPGEKYCSNDETGKCDLTISNNNGHDAVGNYYNWFAATNGTGNASMTSGNATGSVCPDGWSLPQGNNNSTGSFGGLTTAAGVGNNAAGSNTLRAAPYYYVYNGSVNGKNLNDVGVTGLYWSSTASTSGNALYLALKDNYVNPLDGNYYDSYTRYLGIAVRCVSNGHFGGGDVAPNE